MSPEEAQVELPLQGIRHGRRGDPGSLEGELAWVALVLAARRRRNAEILIARWGWSGKGELTLQQVGNRYDLTRERVRQIEARALKHLSKHHFSTPYLSRAIEALRSEPFCVEAEARAALQRRGITRGEFALSGVLAAARVVNGECFTKVVSVGGVRLVTAERYGLLPKWLMSRARSINSKRGAIFIPSLADEASLQFGVELSDSVVQSLFSAYGDTRWLDGEERLWFWLPSVRRNRLHNQILKVLSVANGVGVDDLRRAVSRPHRMRGFAPPRHVLEQFCRQLPAITLEHGRVYASPPVPSEEFVGENERAIWRALSSSSGVMARSELESKCIGAGMNVNSFYIYLAYSPLFERLGAGVYAQLGARVEPGDVEKIQAGSHVDSEPSLVDFGWTERADVWMAMRITHGVRVSGVFGVPPGLRQVLIGEFDIRDEAGASFGKLKCSGPQAWSLAKYFRRRGGDDGDRFVLTWSLDQRVVTVYPGADGPDDLAATAPRLTTADDL